jgi:hypothetical protein
LRSHTEPTKPAPGAHANGRGVSLSDAAKPGPQWPAATSAASAATSSGESSMYSTDGCTARTRSPASAALSREAGTTPSTCTGPPPGTRTTAYRPVDGSDANREPGDGSAGDDVLAPAPIASRHATRQPIQAQ